MLTSHTLPLGLCMADPLEIHTIRFLPCSHNNDPSEFLHCGLVVLLATTFWYRVVKLTISEDWTKSSVSNY